MLRNIIGTLFLTAVLAPSAMAESNQPLTLSIVCSDCADTGTSVEWSCRTWLENSDGHKWSTAADKAYKINYTPNTAEQDNAAMSCDLIGQLARKFTAVAYSPTDRIDSFALIGSSTMSGCRWAHKYGETPRASCPATATLGVLDSADMSLTSAESTKDASINIRCTGYYSYLCKSDPQAFLDWLDIHQSRMLRFINNMTGTVLKPQ